MSSEVVQAFDRKRFIDGQDLVWTMLPEDWDEGPFLGNGCTGVMVYVDEVSGRLHFKPGRTDIYDNRPIEFYTIMDKQFAQPRLQLGPIELRTKGELTGCNLRLSLYNALLTGTLSTTLGTVSVRLWIPRTEEAICLELVPSENESAGLVYLPLPAESPRQTIMREFQDWTRYRESYKEPKPAFPPRCVGGVTVYEQPLYTSGSYCVCMRQNGTHYDFTIAVSDEDSIAVPQALSCMERLNDRNSLWSEHCAYWNHLYERSFFQTNDPVWENYYWVQIYKMACMARPGGRIIDTLGPWCRTTSWPSGFWNLNVQLTYAPMIPTGLFDICVSLPEQLSAQREALNKNIVPEYREGCYGIGTNTCRSLRSEVAVPEHKDADTFKVELGNLSWALFVCYTLSRTTLDEKMLTDTILPLLQGAVRYYMHFLYPDEAGRLHLGPTESPEYMVVDDDTNYDLALLRWGLETLIRENRSRGTEASQIPVWEDVLSKLTDYPQSKEEGLWIAGHTRLSMSHRHYSHLLAFYPLHLLDAKKAADRDLIRRSVAHWHSMPEKLEGYSQTGAASMMAMLGDGNAAIEFLDRLMHNFIRPTTMYREGGGPVTETPLAAVSAIADMLLQSYGGELSVFPAVPERWSDVAFTLYAEGGFKVSALRKAGRLCWIKLNAMADSDVILHAAFDCSPEATGDYTLANDTYRFHINGGESFVFHRPGEAPSGFESKARDNLIFGKNRNTYEYIKPGRFTNK